MSSEVPIPPDGLALPSDFDNVVRLFPLPNLVLFPGVVQALHIFEPRYCEMVKDAVRDDSLITMATVNPEDTDHHDPRPELLPTVCIGKIASHNEFDDGRFNLLLVGAKRAKISEEIVSDLPYRMALVQLVDDSFEYASDDATSLKQQIVGLFHELIERRGVVQAEALGSLFKRDLPLGQISDLICYACGAGPMEQHRVLEEPEVCRRAEILIQILGILLRESAVSSERSLQFPPKFSDN